MCVTSFSRQAKTVAEQMAAKLNTKLNYQPKEDDEDKKADDEPETFRKYEEELEINDFPQQARWRVTSKVRILPFSLLWIISQAQRPSSSKENALAKVP